ncbi:hypothetical protein [Deinococcus sp. NW-56]|uniref:hypothetical protein n=1 Tax=Deinococcus sp. NW-56 TaxID=2080419 RepID=UPI00131A43BD|nr:hypothetical protein [Deinococcus sp. NW-56]
MFNTLVDIPLLMYLLALGGAFFALRLPRGFTDAFVESSLPPMPSVAFALFGFMITAISILTTIKTTPFFASLHKVTADGSSPWKRLVGAFMHLTTVFAFLGIFSISITKERLLALQNENYVLVLFIYLSLVLLAFWATAVAIYLLRLVANAPLPPAEPQIDQVVTGRQTDIVSKEPVHDIQAKFD